jgi:hypothetical protein
MTDTYATTRPSAADKDVITSAWFSNDNLAELQRETGFSRGKLLPFMLLVLDDKIQQYDQPVSSLWSTFERMVRERRRVDEVVDEWNRIALISLPAYTADPSNEAYCTKNEAACFAVFGRLKNDPTKTRVCKRMPNGRFNCPRA